MTKQRVAAALAVLGLLAGCAQVPSSSPVHLGPVVDSGESSQFIRVIAAPPSPGASPTEIVKGFLEANASQQDDWGIARQYLTAGAAGTWDPTASTRIYDGTAMAVTQKGHQVEISVSQVASLAADGTLSVLAEPRTARQRFRVVAVPAADGHDQWRIADPLPGILIRQSDLRRGYRAHPTYFMANRVQTLVPDTRLIPVVGASLPTRMVELVLAGASAGLAPAVHSGAPQGLGLALGAVPVANGVAVVDLGRQVLAASANQRRELAAQLTWTLTELPDVRAVRITVESEPLEISGAPTLMDRDTWAAWRPDSELTGPTGSRLVAHYEMTGRQLQRVSAEGERTDTAVDVPAGVSDLAVALDESRVAMVSAGRRELTIEPIPGRGQPRVLSGTRFTAVSFDVDGRLWYLDAGRLWRLDPDHEPQAVRLPNDLPGEITDFQLARNGARAGLIVGDQPYLAAISITAAAGDSPGKEQVELAAAQPAAIGLSRAIDLGWQGSSSLVLLAAAPGVSLQVQRLLVGEGQPTTAGTPEDPAMIAAAPLVPVLVVGGRDNLYKGVGLQWRETGSARVVAYPG